jgi:hypothetical protein
MCVLIPSQLKSSFIILLAVNGTVMHPNYNTIRLAHFFVLFIHMAIERVFKLEFRYLNEVFAAKVSTAEYANGYVLFKVNIKAGKYWFLKHHEGWRVFGDFKLSKKLESSIIKNIEKLTYHTTNWNADASMVN